MGGPRAQPLQPPTADAVRARQASEGVVVHPSRLPLLNRDVYGIIGNVQRVLCMPTGQSGEWSEAAWHRLFDALSRPKRRRQPTLPALLAPPVAPPPPPPPPPPALPAPPAPPQGNEAPQGNGEQNSEANSSEDESSSSTTDADQDKETDAPLEEDEGKDSEAQPNTDQEKSEEPGGDEGKDSEAQPNTDQEKSDDSEDEESEQPPEHYKALKEQLEASRALEQELRLESWLLRNQTEELEADKQKLQEENDQLLESHKELPEANDTLEREVKRLKLEAMPDLFDDMGEAVSDYNYVVNDREPAVGEVHDGQIEMADFMAAALRPVDGVRTVWALFDVQENVPKQEWSDIVRAIQTKNYAVAFQQPLPENCKVNALAQCKADDTMTIIKTILFESPAPVSEVRAACAGAAKARVRRPGPWKVKKVVHRVMCSITGKFVTWTALKPRSKQGIAYINKHAETDDSQNEMTFCIYDNIREVSDTPIMGWPEGKVRFMVNNKARAKMGAETQHFHPMLTSDLKPVLAYTIVTIIMPLLLEFGIVLLGWPGLGKTPAFITLAMAIGRYSVRNRGATGRPGWRRGKRFDVFRHREFGQEEACFLDDADLGSIDISTIKNFLDVAEDTTADARYNDCKFRQNQMRGIADNAVNEEDEPSPEVGHEIPFNSSYKMMRTAFAGASKAHVMAILKRSIVGVGGKHGFILRLPSKDEDAPVFRFTDDDIADDWLREANKPFLNKFKKGVHTLPPDFQTRNEQEQNMIDAAFAKYNLHMRSADYIRDANEELKKHFQPSPAAMFDNFIPNTLASEDPTRPAAATAKPAAPHGIKVSENRARKDKYGLSYSGTEPTGAQHNVGLTRLEQPAYETILSLSQKQAKKYLEDAGVLPQPDDELEFVCWSCKSPIVSSEGVFRCHGKGCKIRPRVYRPDVAFTLLAGHASSGWDVDNVMCLRTAYALGCTTPNGSCIHYVRREGESVRSTENKVAQFFNKHKIAMACWEVRRAQSTTFEDDVVEPDTCRAGSRKRGGGGPETRAEVEGPLKKALGKGTAVAPDGGKAFHGAAEAAGRQVLKGVNHQRKIFTPASRLFKSKLDSKTTRMLRARTKGKNPSVRETALYSTLSAGDNAAEGITGHLKNTMRRLGNVGRNTSPATCKKNVQALASAALLCNAGLNSVLTALSLYRIALSRGDINLSPKDAFDVSSCSSWLIDSP
ncbi:unnamed protein product [Prorocentrum cordatum]|uniref:Uncharacterized protein n=1 Tax=Prorocentrum cordatum TaxID=2364126 RepID=A0ABN9Q8P9_9DINO|nr:unnamed protein product [Polarella glacialis]